MTTSVRDYLIGQGVASSNNSEVGLGPDQPVAGS
jgi:outer membrane protein OmpA-like peptidoglycan-associated protein